MSFLVNSWIPTAKNLSPVDRQSIAYLWFGTYIIIIKLILLSILKSKFALCNEIMYLAKLIAYV